jgi:DNA-binding Lrp family transcriptional regulator
MARRRLDAIDRKILAELQADGRMTNVDLANRVKITAPPCLRRVRALEKSGFIRGYHADLDGEALGYEVQAFAFVGLESQAEADLRAFEEEVRSWPQVRTCYMLSGEVDFILLCIAHDLPEFQAFITEKLTAAKNVASVKTALVIRQSKRDSGIPVEAG